MKEVLYIKNSSGVNIPTILIIAKFIKSKGLYLGNEDGYSIYSPENLIYGRKIGILMENTEPPKRYFFNLLKKMPQNIFLGYLDLKDGKKWSFFFCGIKNQEYVERFIDELFEYIKKDYVFTEKVDVDKYLLSFNKRYEAEYISTCDFC